jgi:hypothetical protein
VNHLLSLQIDGQEDIFHKTNQHLFGLILNNSCQMKSGPCVDCEGQFRCEEDSYYHYSSLSMILIIKEGKVSHGVSNMLTARCIEMFETLDWHSFLFSNLK